MIANKNTTTSIKAKRKQSTNNNTIEAILRKKWVANWSDTEKETAKM